jgi:uncharacterized coiled-coil DUF342 family protein
MKTKSQAVKAELDKVNERIAEVQPEFDDKSSHLEEVRQAYIRKQASFEDLQANQNVVTLMERTVNELLSRASILQGEYENALAAESRQKIFVDMKSDVSRIKVQLTAYAEARVAVGAAIETLMATRGELRDAKDSLSERVKDTLSERVENIRFIPKHLRREYSAVLEEMNSAGVSKTDLELAFADPVIAETDLERAISAAESTAANMRAQAATASVQRQREQAASRAWEMREAEAQTVHDAKVERAGKLIHRAPVSMSQ